MHPQHHNHPAINMGQYVPHQHHMSNINVSVPPPVNPQHNLQRDFNRHNRINHHMHPPPPAYHGRSNVSTGPKPAPLPMQNKPPLMANNVVQTAIQQGGSLPLMQPKTILKHPSQYKPIISQPQQHQPQTSQPSTLDGKVTSNVNNVQTLATASTLHSIPSQSHSNNLPGGAHNPVEKVKPNTTAEKTVPKYNAVSSSKQLNKSSTTPTTSPDTSIIEVSAASDQIKQLSIGDSVGQSKDKTPMCLVNELARFNKITHQYRLTGEQGPAHKKRFTVTLKLGEEEYSSDGASIKKAQHLAAADAITKTQYKHPPAKLNRSRINGKIDGRGNDLGNITPTVELNALAMKRGEPAIYMIDSPASGQLNMGGSQVPPHGVPMPPQPNQFMPPNPAGYNSQYGYYQPRNNPQGHFYPQQRFGHDRRPMGRGYGKLERYSQCPYNYPTASEDPYKVTLQVGQRKFVGIGHTVQSARHDAASKALEVLKPITPEYVVNEAMNTSEDDINAELKSPVSLVHEMALKRDLTVSFEVISEKGPPHMKIFVTGCRVGDITTEAEGNGKKLSKKRAAEAMINKLKELPPSSPIAPIVRVKQIKRKPLPTKKKTRNLIKESDEDSEGLNPISRLIHIAQTRKAKEPVYTLVEERGAPRRREFTMEVSCVKQTAQGTGQTKKLAKRQAAQNLLISLGYTVRASPNRDAVKDSNDQNEKTKSVKFQDSSKTTNISNKVVTNQGGTAGRQLVPGLLLVQQDSKVNTTPKCNNNSETTKTNDMLDASQTSSLDDSIGKSNLNVSSGSADSGLSNDGVRPTDQLTYLAQILGFKVTYSDFPKGNHGEYLTLITLSTEPPQLCHGAGSNFEASHDQAASTALKMLSELGLHNVVPNKKCQEPKTGSVPISNGINK
ncbi:double-stranded RNA-binding protein Staufen homolog 2 isoform X1 [Bradysia coprophila]|uniref:double-stranded RNA-binding protein Staufen homolog 2 isoform X1 n=1 Tax=Bradysia coprophila TaxID=38358 RepID=UPI00187DBFAD|nr:double-stranded RNA-binding protein Staufen homolog 2 isoform X1 [Bradysia coprophila]XP_037034841.1 double-stranded RNA-binding protein Staufen homolog 2 isoform X1 [Bradysia coprophila]XP_037034842.1 double-stranded RNA-binding protein Staufen homolog 2 isoform X1 [Bradysia coprophila]